MVTLVSVCIRPELVSFRIWPLLHPQWSLTHGGGVLRIKRTACKVIKTALGTKEAFNSYNYSYCEYELGSLGVREGHAELGNLLFMTPVHTFG